MLNRITCKHFPCLVGSQACSNHKTYKLQLCVEIFAGTNTEMSELEKKFLSGVYTPFEPERIGPLLEKDENESAPRPPPAKKPKKRKLQGLLMGFMYKGVKHFLDSYYPRRNCPNSLTHRPQDNCCSHIPCSTMYGYSISQHHFPPKVLPQRELGKKTELGERRQIRRMPPNLHLLVKVKMYT